MSVKEFIKQRPRLKAVALRTNDCLVDLQLVFMNNIVTHIPAWAVRKVCLRACGVTIGRGSRILMGTRIQGPKGITIGEHSIVNSHCHLDGRGGLTIGNNVNISNYSKIISGSHDMRSPIFQYRDGPIIIEDYCWLGSGSIVLDKSHLKRATVLSAGSVFKGVSEEDSVLAGIPAIIVKKRGFNGSFLNDYRPFFI